jgi:heat shock protein HslJ
MKKNSYNDAIMKDKKTASKINEIILAVVVVLALLFLGVFLLRRGQPENIVQVDFTSTTTSNTTGTQAVTPETVINSEGMAEVVGFYEADLGAASGGERKINLALQADGGASLETSYGGREPVVQSGTWQIIGGKIVVTLAGEDEEVMNFASDGQGGLTLVDYDLAIWGTDGLSLQRVMPLEGTVWQWLETTTGVGEVVRPNQVGAFQLNFEADGSLLVQTDCNSGRSSYVTEGGGTMRILPVAATLKFCEGSQETVFLSQLILVSDYELGGERLDLLLSDGGVMVLRGLEN